MLRGNIEYKSSRTTGAFAESKEQSATLLAEPPKINPLSKWRYCIEHLQLFQFDGSYYSFPLAGAVVIPASGQKTDLVATASW